MKRINILPVLLSLFLLNACIKDTGNYEYKKGNDVSIKVPVSLVSAYLGDTTKVDMVRTYSNPDDTTEFDHAWYVDGILYSNERILTYVGKEPGLKNITYYMTDRKSGTVYSMSNTTVFWINVTSSFQNGWGILYEKDGKSELGHVRVTNGQYTDYMDLYKQYNNGQELGSLPVKIRDYQVSGGRGLYVLQNGGQGPVELDGLRMQKKLAVSDAFIGGVPAGYSPVDMAFYATADLMVNTNGDLYARFFNGALPFTVPFMSTPLSMRGGLKVGDILDSWSRTSTFAFLYDKLNKRLLRTRVNQFSTGGGITIDTLIRPATPYPADYTPLNNLGSWEYVWGGTFNDVSPSMDGTLILKSPDDQKLYYQTFNYIINAAGETLTPRKRILFPANDYVTPATKYVALKGRNYLFFTGGSNNEKLYYYDAQSESIVKLYADLPGKITVITASDDSQQVAVGLEDGTFILFDVSNATIISGASKELHRFGGMGKIIDIIVRGGSMS